MIRSIFSCALLLLTCAGALGAQPPHPITLQEDLTPRTCRGGSSAGAACTSHDDCRPGGLCGPPILAEQLDDNFRALRVLFDGSVTFFDLYLPGATTCALPCTDRAVCVDTDAAGSGLMVCRSGSWAATGAGSVNSFETVATSSGSAPVADSSTDTLTLTGAAPVTVTGDAGTDTVTLAVSSATETALGVVELATSIETAPGLVVQASDTRLSDARAPTGAASGDLAGTYPGPTLAADGVGLDELAACAGPSEIVEYGASGVPACIATPGGGSSIILDLGDDGTNESTALAEIATVNMPTSMWTEPTADKLLVDGSIPWKATTEIDADGDGNRQVWVGAASLSSSAVFVGSDNDNGTAYWAFDQNYFRPWNIGGGVWLFRGTPSATSPTMGPHQSDLNTGLGWASADSMTLVAGGNAVVTAAHDGSRGLVTIADLLRLHNAATPPSTCAAGIAGSLYYDTTTPSVCVCNGSAWTPMWPTGGDCT